MRCEICGDCALLRQSAAHIAGEVRNLCACTRQRGEQVQFEDYACEFFRRRDKNVPTGDKEA